METGEVFYMAYKNVAFTNWVMLSCLGRGGGNTKKEELVWQKTKADENGKDIKSKESKKGGDKFEIESTRKIVNEQKECEKEGQVKRKQIKADKTGKVSKKTLKGGKRANKSENKSKRRESKLVQTKAETRADQGPTTWAF